MAFNLKLPNFLSGTQTPSDQTAAAQMVMDSGVPASIKTGESARGFLEQYSSIKQLQILGGILLLIVMSISAFQWHEHRESDINSAYIATATRMQMLSQRLSKASSFALQGNAASFEQLRDSHTIFSNDLGRLTAGGELFEISSPPSPDSVQPQLQAVTNTWKKIDENTLQLLEMEKNLVELGRSVQKINENSAQLLDLSEQIVTLKLQTNAGTRDIFSASQLGMLTQRISKNATALLVGDEIAPEIVFLLGKDTYTFRELLTGLAKGSEALRITASGDPETKRKLAELEDTFKEFQEEVSGIPNSAQKLMLAKQAGSRLHHDSETLLEACATLTAAYQDNSADQVLHNILLAVLVMLALAVIFLMVKIYNDDMRHQTESAEKNQRASEAVNRQNQGAILRLMNELGNLADGNLTVTATVSEDITGAIADSINYTIEELRVLVGRINDAADRVTLATEIAQQTSVELLDAAKRQSVEIQDAGHSVLSMASSMTKVSGEANQSAQVARQSLAAAGKGTLAVQDSIKGMNEIRDQIQETSKRIKRLGESSQEIGEIVELISDITEQTNVLALNAAIQAASAGEAGRGFTVVAEEVQRLAERSGEATKQIAAIVKTIQTDTQGAVSAMEESTRGVVEGAKLSDAAGQALAEIGEVSQNLAELIEGISHATRQQADSATGVAGKMQDILRVTEQTTAGTQKTASAVGELANLATELKGSVAGFKVS